MSIEATRRYERLERPVVVGGAPIASGRYDFDDVTLSYSSGTQRRTFGTVTLQRGQFYDGTITALGLGRGRVEVTPRLTIEPSFSINRIEIPAGVFATRLIRSRVDYAFTPRVFASAFLQYSPTDHTVSTNFRFRGEYRPGSELFVVYIDERTTTTGGVLTVNNRTFVVKINRLLRF